MHRLQTVGTCCGVIDITAIGTQQVTPEQWYASIVGSLANTFRLEINVRAWWRDRNHQSLVNRLSEFIETVLLSEIEQNGEMSHLFQSSFPLLPTASVTVRSDRDTVSMLRSMRRYLANPVQKTYRVAGELKKTKPSIGADSSR
jgi:hypothetical protein